MYILLNKFICCNVADTLVRQICFESFYIFGRVEQIFSCVCIHLPTYMSSSVVEAEKSVKYAFHIPGSFVKVYSFFM